ncbi:MAG: flagellar hook-associated protein FlgK [Bacteroidota bacterium]
MSLSAALSTATSSLRTIQTQLSVASNNIANADDVNYTAKTAKQSTVVAGGTGVGVNITSIASDVDNNLVRSIVDATAADSAAQTFLSYMQSLSDALGSLSSDGAGDTLATSLSSLESTLDELATTPESATLANQAVSDLEDVTADLRSASDDVQTLRTNADGDIADAVNTVNDALHQIDSLNQSIVRAQGAGQPTGDLEDKRNAALQTISAEMGITTYTDSTGAMKVYTTSGQVLLGDDVHELSFTAASSVKTTSAYPATLSGISVDGQDITKSIQTGEISSLVTLRDTTLPSVQKDLDALATELRDTLNTISNQGSAAPPPNSLTGTASVSAADSLSATGTLRVAVTDSDGKVVSTQDIDMTTVTSVSDLLTTLNSVPGLNASVNSDGKLVLKATSSSNGVAISGGSIGSKNVSGYFGLNDMVVGTTAANVAVKADLAGDTSRLPIGSVSTATTLSVGDKAVTSGSGTLAQSMADALRSADLTGDAGSLVSNVATKLSSAKSRATSTETTLNTLVDSFSSQYGVNTDEETARISELQNAYSASAQVLSAVTSMFNDLLQAVR